MKYTPSVQYAVAAAEAEERSAEQQFDDDQVVGAFLEPALAYVTTPPRPDARECLPPSHNPHPVIGLGYLPPSPLCLD